MEITSTMALIVTDIMKDQTDPVVIGERIVKSLKAFGFEITKRKPPQTMMVCSHKECSMVCPHRHKHLHRISCDGACAHRKGPCIKAEEK